MNNVQVQKIRAIGLTVADAERSSSASILS